jgi:DNA excision repair protein ERCC-6
LVRKGILTPFHQLKGFERRLQQPGSSSGKNESIEEDKTDGLDSDSVVRAAHSMLEAAKARPTTKLLDSEALPKLDAPTRPFQRLKTPLKACQSPERDAEKRKGSERKRKRPLPGKKWRKSASWEDMGESGMYSIFLS